MRAPLQSIPLSRSPLPLPLGLAVAAGLVAVETAVMLLFKMLAPDNAFGVLYLIGVLVIAVGWGAGLTAGMAVISAIAYDHFRRWPDTGQVLTQLQDWVVLVVFVVVALVAHALARTARTRAADAEERRHEADANWEALRACPGRSASRASPSCVTRCARSPGIRDFPGRRR
ncbi:hypothetical protein MSIMFB_00267 [Mycobacterium simulans]|uniref:Sensor protein KdpD transmembrane domain-containing protein n=1 Tax=Mycobacterium simulans TaxID=627089 RepID=A0A7Z7IIL5_9MYCO|nr:DUF4118 domain-containing protein [Mycobacterium simulans]SOJ52759.1 hypothetical protein MSIMFB_00267 [Mycobacterium simulans]